MTPSYDRQRKDDGPGVARNSISWRYEAGCENDHQREYQEADDERQPESAQYSRDLDEEVRPFNLLLSRAPRDIVREEVREESLGQVNR